MHSYSKKRRGEGGIVEGKGVGVVRDNKNQSKCTKHFD